MSRTIDEYLELPYRISLVHDADDEGNSGWVAEIEELPGCMSQGGSVEEAVDNLSDAMVAWISVALEDGTAVPEPRALNSHSGRLLLRMPKGLHSALAAEASAEEVPLNGFIVSVLAGAVGWRSRDRNEVPA